MNILMALSNLESTGIEIYGTILSDELMRRGNNVYILSDNTLKKRSHAEYVEIDFYKSNLLERMSQVNKILKIIKEKNIHVVHVNSKITYRSCSLACKLANIPLITTIHGKTQAELKYKINKTFGDYTIALCENIAEKALTEWNLEEERVTVLRSMINTDLYKIPKVELYTNNHSKKIISIFGRLVGIKGDIIFKILDTLSRRSDLQIRVIGEENIPDRFKKFIGKVEFLGCINDVCTKICESSLVIASGRIAIEGLLNKIPVLAIGEKEFVGVVNESNLEKGLKSNFGEFSFGRSKTYIFESVISEIQKGLSINTESLEFLKEIVVNEYSIKNIIYEIEEIYKNEYSKKRI